jgi:beta-N-acetylhexosaminidase
VIAIDEEGGDVTRLEATRGSSVPGNLALGVVDDVALTERVARALGEELRAVGVTHDLAPVADVNTNPLNPVIGVRSFGPDPALVSRHVAAFVEGLQASGVAACAKHFPGHGATEVDSHVGLPTVATSREALLEIELAPFRAAIAAGTRAIMTAHIVVPAIDSAPATLSRPHLTGLLREELGFTGMIITDALEMQAISATVGMEEGAVLALAAGADALCLGHDIDAGHVARVRAAIVRAVRDGRLSEELLAAAGARVSGSGVAPAALRAQAETPADETLAEVGLEAARRAVRCEETVTVAGPLAVVELGTPPSVAAGTAAHDLASVLTERGADVVPVRLDGSGLEPAAVIAAHPDRRLVIVVRDADRHPWARTTAETLVAGSSGAVIVDVGYPGVPVGPPGTSRVSTFGAARASYVAAAECILG